MVKKGGKCCFAINEKWRKGNKYLSDTFDWHHDLEGKMSELESEGKWKHLETENRDGYFEGIPGNYYVFQVL